MPSCYKVSEQISIFAGVGAKARRSYSVTAQQEAAALFRVKLGRDGRGGGHVLGMELRAYRRWKGQGGGKCSSECHARLLNLMSIDRALRMIFRKPGRAYSWIRTDNAAFDGVSALHLMLDGELADIMRVRATWKPNALVGDC